MNANVLYAFLSALGLFAVLCVIVAFPDYFYADKLHRCEEFPLGAYYFQTRCTNKYLIEMLSIHARIHKVLSEGTNFDNGFLVTTTKSGSSSAFRGRADDAQTLNLAW